MKRKDFLKGIGLAGLGLGLPKTSKASAEGPLNPPGDACTLIPSETAGPFPLDLTANTYYFRKDLRETKTGVPLTVKLKILGSANCLPMQNVRVNIWHCDKDGLYSGYSQTNNAGQAGLTYLRGYQMTDANGEVEFLTIFPGWYTGRICHIHFQVYVSSSYAAISQLTFDIAKKNAIYAANTALYTKGTDPMTLSSDNIFSDGYAYQLATLTPNTTTGGYDTYLEVTVQGSGTVGLGHIEKETAKYMTLGQNYPNPSKGNTKVPFTLKDGGNVKLSLWDLNGKMVAEFNQEAMAAGDHIWEIDLNALGLPIANYAYQLEVANSQGVYKDCKIMTAQ